MTDNTVYFRDITILNQGFSKVPIVCYDKAMITVKNKPTTLLIATPILGVGMLIGLGYVLYILVGSFLALKSAGLEIFIGISAMLLYVVQIVLYIVISFFLLRGIYRWSRAAIIASTVASPLALVVVVASIANQFGYVVDLSSPVGIGLLIFFLLTPLIMGVIAYNDIHYRLPKVN
jgi:hypothetical protein